MKNVIAAFVVICMIFLYGCYSTAPVIDPADIPEEDAEAPVEEEVVHVLDPEPVVEEDVEETVVEESKQIVTGATDVESEELSIVSEVSCSYGLDGPEQFSFRLTNVEGKKWVFNSLSYSARETSENPIFVLNALQVTNQQIQEACGKKSLAVGSSVVCNFNLETQTQKLVRKHIRTGVTPLGAENENTLSVRTSGHAAEVRFLCE